MVFFLDKFESLNCSWNRKPLTEEIFYKLCRRSKITVQEMPLRVGGFYYSMLGRHYIAINSSLPSPKKLFVMFHEYAHFLLHAPDTGVTANFHGVGRKTRKELEADAFTLCALVPRTMIETRSVRELVEDDGLPSDLVAERLELYNRSGV